MGVFNSGSTVQVYICFCSQHINSFFSPRSRSRERPRVRGRSPRRSPPIAIRRSPPGVRRSPPGMRRSPPGVRKHRSPSPPSRGSVHTRLGARGPFSGDSREVAMRRDVDRVRRVSGEHILRERERERQASACMYAVSGYCSPYSSLILANIA